MDTNTSRIRTLNDELRQNFIGGRAVITPGVAALGQAAVARIIKTIAVFDDFCQANDPYEEHDFGSFEAEGPKLVPYVGRFDGFHAMPASASKTCLVRFDNNKYSVAACAVGRPVENPDPAPPAAWPRWGFGGGGA